MMCLDFQFCAIQGVLKEWVINWFQCCWMQQGNPKIFFVSNFFIQFFTTFQCPSFNLFSILSNSSNFTFFQFCSHCFARFDESFSLVHCHLSLKGFICDFKGCRQKRSMRRINLQVRTIPTKKVGRFNPCDMLFMKLLVDILRSCHAHQASYR